MAEVSANRAGVTLAEPRNEFTRFSGRVPVGLVARCGLVGVTRRHLDRFRVDPAGSNVIRHSLRS